MGKHDNSAVGLDHAVEHIEGGEEETPFPPKNFIPDEQAKHRPGMKYVGGIGDGELFVAMVVHRDECYVASNQNVYKIVNDRLMPLEFAVVVSDEPQSE